MAGNGPQINDDDDPVIRKIPVYLSKPQDKKLFVFQYPLRSVSTIDVDKHDIIAARIKPKLQEVELELRVKPGTQNYDHSKGEQIVVNADGPEKFKNPDHLNFFSGDLMNKITYSSTKAEIKPGRFTVGYVSNNELHLSPIHGILHMKPSFPYLDKADSKPAKKDAKDKDNGVDTAESGDDDEAMEQVTVKFARTETDRSKQARERSYGHLQSRNAQEVFINTKFFAAGSEQSQNAKESLVSLNTEGNMHNMNRQKKTYVKDLFGPTPESELLQKISTSSGAASKKTIRQMSNLSDQVKNLLIKAKLLSFSQLCASLDITTEAQRRELLKSLQVVADLVLGNWVIKSEILYPAAEKDKPTKLCGVTGIHPRILTRARDHVLHLFTQNELVERKKVTLEMGIPTEEMKAILEQFAIKTKKDWKFKLPVDQDFIDKNEDVVKRYELVYQKKLSNMAVTEKFKAPKKEFIDSPKSSRTRRRSRKESCGSDSGSDSRESKKATSSGSNKKK